MDPGSNTLSSNKKDFEGGICTAFLLGAQHNSDSVEKKRLLVPKLQLKLTNGWCLVDDCEAGGSRIKPSAFSRYVQISIQFD